LSQIAPSPRHGAAYEVALDAIGGPLEVGNCLSNGAYRDYRAKLDALLAWSEQQPDTEVVMVYRWGVERVDADLRARLALYENARAVAEARASLPMPTKALTGNDPFR